MTDFLLLEKIHRMIKDVPKPRLMHKKGISVKGYFRPYMSLSEYTESEIFGSVEKVTPVSIRFSSMLGDESTPDSRRNIKCMSVKFRNDEEEYDIICQSIPVYFIDDANKFIELSQAFTVNNLFDGINREEVWRFILNNPESINCFLRLFSYKGLSDSYIYTKWFSVNSCVWINSLGIRRYIRYKWIPVTKKGHDEEHNNTRIRSEFMSGFDPEKARNELENAITYGDFPQYNLIIQMAATNEGERYTLCWNDNDDIEEIDAGILKITSLDDKDEDFDPLSKVNGINGVADKFMDYMAFAHKIGCTERGHHI